MSKKGEKSRRKENLREQITAEESLKRMKGFAERREEFIAAIKKSKNRNIPAGTRK